MRSKEVEPACKMQLIRNRQTLAQQKKSCSYHNKPLKYVGREEKYIRIFPIKAIANTYNLVEIIGVCYNLYSFVTVSGSSVSLSMNLL